MKTIIIPSLDVVDETFHSNPAFLLTDDYSEYQLL